jgi:hypothetical protein
MKRKLSGFSIILSGVRGRIKDGQPVPLLYLSLEEKRGSPEMTSTYIPSRC